MNEKLFDYIAVCPTAFHTCAHSADMLRESGYTELCEAHRWEIVPGGKYFVTRNGSSLIAFRVPAGEIAGFMMTAAHGDSPAFKIKENAELSDGTYLRLSVEKYGGMLCAPWLDRPLSVAGRVLVSEGDKLSVKLVDLKAPCAIIPNVAIHMNRNANDGMSYNAAVDMLPVWMSSEKGSFRTAVAKAAGVAEDAIVTAVEFRDKDDAVVYKAANPAGVGEFDWNADGKAVVFWATPSLTQKVVPETETVPETTAETAPETTDETAVTVTIPETTAETVPDTTEETVPFETLSAIPTKPVVTDTAPEDVTFTESETRTMEYWDDDAQKTMVVAYRYAKLPAYTMELTLAPGAYRFDGGYALLTQVWSYRDSLLFIMGACLLLFAVLTVYLCCAAGRKPGSEEVHAAGFNCIPLDIYLAGGGLIIFGLFMVIVQFYDAADLFSQSIQTVCAGVLMAGYVMSLIFVGFCFACAAQFKTPGGYWWRNSVCWRCMNLLVKCVKGCFSGCGWLLRKLPKAAAVFWDFLLMLLTPLRWLWKQIKRTCAKIGKSINRIYSMMPLTWQWLLTGFIMVMLLFAALAGRSNLMVVLSLCACVAVVLYGAYCFGILLESAKRMGKGDLDTKVDDKYLTGAFKSFAGDLNDLAGVAVVAAQKQLKSERMKTELITNVSHDIKTPLTSIINYVDLLQKPHTPEEEKTYLEVLNRQSQRLKKLIEDLMEMSKASTGNLTADITKLDAVESVNQALGEFADKLEKAQLTPVFRHPEESVAMMADGRLAWRVLSNLLSNTVKYALPGTRVYIDVMAVEGKVIISLKNISRDELNVDADELMERFVRGDDSRNTEGSGLGLNIAKTLMELQKGQLQLLVDGDLFKVTLIFPGA